MFTVEKMVELSFKGWRRDLLHTGPMQKALYKHRRPLGPTQTTFQGLTSGGEPLGRVWKVTLSWKVSRECSGPNVWDMLYFQMRWQSASCCQGKVFTKHLSLRAVFLSVPSTAWSPLLFLSLTVFQAVCFAFTPCEMPCIPSADHCLPTFLY